MSYARVVALAAMVIFGVACGSLILIRPFADEWSPAVQAAAGNDAPQHAPCAHADPLRQAFWGDLHVHTHYSIRTFEKIPASTR